MTLSKDEWAANVAYIAALERRREYLIDTEEDLYDHHELEAIEFCLRCARERCAADKLKAAR